MSQPKKNETTTHVTDLDKELDKDIVKSSEKVDIKKEENKVLVELEETQERLDMLTTIVTQNLSNAETKNMETDPLASILAKKSVYNVLVVGCGGREHAIIKALTRSKFNITIYNTGHYCNPGIQYMCKNILLTTKTSKVISYAVDIKADLVIIGPENYLECNLAGELSELNIPCFGPSEKLAKIETNKSYARHLMTDLKFNKFIPKYRYFIEYNESNIMAYFKELNNNFVVKANGLCSGKGVKIMHKDFNTIDQALVYCNQLFKEDKVFLVEEKLEGKEFSAMSFVDGHTISHMPLVMDYPRANDDDTGEQTGGMGSITMADHKLPFVTQEDLDTVQNINQNVILKIQTDNNELYKGVLYGSYMKTDSGIKLIEFNSRFGDPEAINILGILDCDFMELCLRVVNSCLKLFKINYRNTASVVVYNAPIGYPKSIHADREIYTYGIDRPEDVYYAGIKICNQKTEKMVLTGSRAIACIGYGNSLTDARRDVYSHINKIYGPLYHRKDIGKNIGHLSDTSKMDAYSVAGVNVDTNTEVVESIREIVESTHDSKVLSKHGDFSGLLQVKNGILSLSIDGTGTKSLLLTKFLDDDVAYNSLGQDIVNHCINDCLVSGALPYAFLDYFASSRINPKLVKAFLTGIRDACKPVNCRIMGGETAEMPSIYNEECSDLVGVMMGYLPNKKALIDTSKISAGDSVFAWGSSGPHTNGYSLIRKIINDTQILAELSEDERTEFIKYLIAPHTSYYEEYQRYLDANIKINGMVHITGGGIIENVPRVLPHGLKMCINIKKLYMPTSFKLLQSYGNISDDDMYRTFNCGIGMVVIVPRQAEKYVNAVSKHSNWKHIWKLGSIKEKYENESTIEFV